MIQASPVPLGAPLTLAGAPATAAPALPRWRPAPHKWTPRPGRLGSARMGQFGPLGIDYPLISLAIDIGAGAVAYAALRKSKPQGVMLYITWGVLILSGLRALSDAAKLITLVLTPRS